MPITVPGGSTDVTVSAGEGDALNLAAQIGAILKDIQTTSGSLDVVTTSGSAPYPSAPTTGGATQLVLTSPTVAGVIPSGYDYVVVSGSSGTPATVVASNTQVIGNDDGGTFIVSGNSTVAATGGENV